MSELVTGPQLVGTKVKNAARPEWGVGTVLRVQPTRAGDKPAHRVSIQFAVGHRTLLVPPARLVTPQPEPQRETGWLAGLGKRSLDDQLRVLPEQVTHVLGTLRERLAAVLPLYVLREESPALLRWASSQIGVADPLAHWTRDELLAAFHDFCAERDAHLRVVAALLKQAEGPEALEDVLRSLPMPLRQSVQAALRQPV